jgi:hypothetical protein
MDSYRDLLGAFRQFFLDVVSFTIAFITVDTTSVKFIRYAIGPISNVQ